MGLEYIPQRHTAYQEGFRDGCRTGIQGLDARDNWDAVDWVGFTDALDHLDEIRRAVSNGSRDNVVAARYYAGQVLRSLTK